MRIALILLVLIADVQTIEETDEHKETTIDETQSESERIFTKCYDDLGCVSTDETWYHDEFRPVNLKPLDRHVIRTEFVLIRKNRTIVHNELYYQVITSTDESIKSTGYTTGIFLFVLIHDFTSNGYAGWVKHISRVLKSRTKKCNIIAVDWHAGAVPIYDQAIANGRVVALEIVHMLKYLTDKHELTLDQVHLIGHGVGAHIAGYVGSSLKTYKITGLNPSGPRFENMPNPVRLDPTDALYVEVLHTDASEGAKGILGHTDFFINNAQMQPGCPANQKKFDVLKVTKDSLGEGEILPGCSHKRAYKYYIESLEVEECTFLGIKCDSFEDFKQGKCTECGPNCRTFGLITYSVPNNGSFFLNTASARPYCMYQYKVTITIRGDKSKYIGFFEFILIDKNHFTTISSMLEPREFTSGSENSFVFYAGVPEMGQVVRAKVGWFQKKNIFCLFNCKETIDVMQIKVQSLNSNSKKFQEIELCSREGMSEIQNGDFLEFTDCKKSKP